VSSSRPEPSAIVDSLHEYITGQSSEARADRDIVRIVAFCMGLTTFPLRGQRRDDLLPGLRTIGFERRVTIAFVATADAVIIERHFLRRAGLRSHFPR